MARPKNIRPTEAKTWSFYCDDVNELLNSGKSPKEIFSLGILAHKRGWNPHQDGTQNQELKERIGKLALQLTATNDKLFKLYDIFETAFNLRIEEPEDFHKVEEKLKDLIEVPK